MTETMGERSAPASSPGPEHEQSVEAAEPEKEAV
jgi:hypothetical protein